MALSGIQIYKMLPQTNCKDCDFPTCLAFAMKLAAKQVELAKCPHVSEESKAKLSEAAAPPVRPITLKSNGYAVQYLGIKNRQRIPAESRYCQNKVSVKFKFPVHTASN